MNPSTQYATETNLRARQRLWQHQQPAFDFVAWVLDVAGLEAGSTARVLDVGCGNGTYLKEMCARRISAIGCDLSWGMLASAPPTATVLNADAVRLPFGRRAFDVVLAPHMLYHVTDRTTAGAEMRRVLASSGRCIAVTNGHDHMRSLRSLIESAVQVATPGWEMKAPSTHAFSLENGAEQLAAAFDQIECIRSPDSAPAVLTDAAVAAGYVASVGDMYQSQTSRPWPEVVADVRQAVQAAIDTSGSFEVRAVSGAFVCQ